jgi:hypothetical protein
MDFLDNTVFFFYPEKFRGRTGGSIINDQVSSVEIFAGAPSIMLSMFFEAKLLRLLLAII